MRSSMVAHLIQATQAAESSTGGGGGSAPFNSVLPSISGTPKIPNTLTVSNGTWSNSPTSYSYQWLRSGVNIGGATTSSYQLVSADLLSTITCSVTATNSSGSGTATSAATTAVTDIYTNALGFQVSAFLLDSFAQGSNNNTGVGPTPTSQTAYYWNHNTNQNVEITNTDVLGAANGSMIPQYCISRYTRNSRKNIVVLGGFSGSKFYDAAGSNSWNSLGTLRSSLETRMDACLAANSVDSPSVINVTSGGINDINGASVIADVATAIADFFVWITTKYPNARIQVCIPGRTNSTENMNNRFAVVREALYKASQLHANVHIAVFFPQYVGRSLFGVDLLHLTQTGNNQAAQDLVACEFSTYNKNSNVIMNMMTASISNTKKTAINSFVVNQHANSNWQKLDTLQVWVSEAEQDALTDWRLRTCTKLVGASWGSKTGITLDGIDDYIKTEFIPSLQSINGSVNDYFVKIMIIDNTTAAGTQANAIGVINSTQRISLFQNTSSQTVYQCNDGGATSPLSEILQDNTLYTVARPSSTQKRILKNGNQVILITQAVTAIPAREIFVGALNNIGTPASFMSGRMGAFVIGQEASFNHSSFDSELLSLLTTLGV
jgi:hypothetical protein